MWSSWTKVGKLSMGELLAWMMPTADDVENNLTRRMEKSEGVWIVRHVVELNEEEEGTGRPGWRSKCWTNQDLDGEGSEGAARGADPSAGHMHINAMNHVKFVKIGVMGSLKFVKLLMTSWSRVRYERRSKRLEKRTTNANRSNKLGVLNLNGRGLEVEEGERS